MGNAETGSADGGRLCGVEHTIKALRQCVATSDATYRLHGRAIESEAQPCSQQCCKVSPGCTTTTPPVAARTQELLSTCPALRAGRF
jgi:hypothetical protein